jgi:hypothetical protein
MSTIEKQKDADAKFKYTLRNKRFKSEGEAILSVEQWAALQRVIHQRTAAQEGFEEFLAVEFPSIDDESEEGRRLAKTWYTAYYRAAGESAFAQGLKIHEDLLDNNAYAYFELSYTRTTMWMIHICDKPANAATATNEFASNGRKILHQGQGSTPEEAALDLIQKIGNL